MIVYDVLGRMAVRNAANQAIQMHGPFSARERPLHSWVYGGLKFVELIVVSTRNRSGFFPRRPPSSLCTCHLSAGRGSTWLTQPVLEAIQLHPSRPALSFGANPIRARDSLLSGGFSSIHERAPVDMPYKSPICRVTLRRPSAGNAVRILQRILASLFPAVREIVLRNQGDSDAGPADKTLAPGGEEKRISRRSKQRCTASCQDE